MNNKRYLYIFFLLLPIIDLITSITTRLFNPTISLGVIIKIVFLLTMLYYIFFKSESKPKKISIGYILFVFTYILLYFVSKINYISISMLINECNYLIKMLYFPISLLCLFCFFDDKKLNKEDLHNILIINLITYVVLLFIPLITNTGFNSYEYTLNGSIGWFYAANEISIILILLFPYIYIILKRKNPLCLTIPVIIIFIISTIGTKVSTFGIIIDSIILLFLSFLFKEKKKILISTITIFVSTALIFFLGNPLKNLKNSISIQEWQETARKEEIASTNTLDKYSKALLSDRDLYVKKAFKLYKKNFNANTLLFGLGYTNNSKINDKNIEKSVEIDILDIFLHHGLIALIIVMAPFFYYFIQLLKKRIFNIKTVFYTLILGLIFGISSIAGHSLTAPAVSMYISIIFILCLNELSILKK